MILLDRSLCFAGSVLALLAACGPIDYSSQEVLLRHDPKQDTLDVLILYDGIQAQPQKQLFTPDTDGIEEGQKFVRQVLAHRRDVFVFGGHLDMEEILERAEEEGTQARPEVEREAMNCLKLVRVERSGFFRGADGRLGLYQHLRLRETQRFIRLANLAIARAVEEAVEEGRLEDATWLDAETRASWISLARDRRPVLTLGAHGLEVELPMTPASAAELLSAMTRSSAEDPDTAEFLAALLASLTEITIADGKLRLRWEQLEFRFATLHGDDSSEFDGTLAARIEAWAGFPESVPAREAAIAELARR